MTGDGRSPADPARDRTNPRTPLRRLRCPRTTQGDRAPARLLVLTCGPTGAGAPPDEPPPAAASELIDRLDGADVVFTTAAAEPTVLFYAEAWRVERLGTDLAPLAAGLTTGTVVLVTGDCAADAALVDSLPARLPGVLVERCGPALVPPRSRPLGRGA
jgi:hypothetical protein